jgi:cytochrome c-type biogenesis protein CcmH
MKRAPGWPIVAAALVATAVAIVIGWRQSPPSIADRTMQIASVLRCPVCHAQSVADSQAPAAVQMRTEIERQLTLGRSADEIESSFVDQYGSGVLMSPPVHGAGSLVWVAPLIALALGVAIAMRFARRRSSEAIA